MLSNYYILREIARDIAPRLRGDTITDIFTQEKDELALTFARTPGALILCCRGDANCVFFHPAFSRSRRNSASIFDSCTGVTVEDVSLHPADRVLSLSLSDGREITARFFGPQANVLLVQHGKVAGAFKSPAQLVGSAYQPPPPAMPVDLTSLEILTTSTRTPSDVVRRSVPSLGIFLARDAIARAGLADVPGPHDTDTVARISKALVLLLGSLEHPAPVLYRRHDGPLLSPVRLAMFDAETPEPVTDIHAAVRSVLFSRRSRSVLSHRKETIVSILRHHLDRLRRTMDAVHTDLSTSRRAEEYERSGRLLIEHLAAVTRGAETVRLLDRGSPVEIALDPRLSPSQNAQRYFEKAKRSKTASAEASVRQSRLADRNARASGLLSALAAVEDPDGLTTFLREHATAMKEFGIGDKGEPQEAPPFRVFTVDGGFEVWAGKSSENNDLLTLRHARPNDLWFHARGSSGSHVVLRVGSAEGTPGKRAKEQAAGIAAYYSKMKTSRLVPVAMTERKYVRKPRGAKPGTVTLEREQVIFAVPRLPTPEES